MRYKNAIMYFAIAACMLIFAALYYSDMRAEREYMIWAQEQNRLLNESRSAAETESVEIQENVEATEIVETAVTVETTETEKTAERSENKESTETTETADLSENVETPTIAENGTDATQTEQPLRYITTDGVNVRNTASLSGGRIGTLEEGTVLEEAQAEGDWIRFRYGDGEGYVSAEFVAVEEE